MSLRLPNWCSSKAVSSPLVHLRAASNSAANDMFAAPLSYEANGFTVG